MLVSFTRSRPIFKDSETKRFAEDVATDGAHATSDPEYYACGSGQL